jgi:phage/plasmid-like protein (TIGR03299 family)
MAHGILNNKDFAFVGQTAWHGLGVTPESGVITPDFLRQSTGFCHTVTKEPYRYADGSESFEAFYLITNRGDIIAERVGNRYTVLQCEDILEMTAPLLDAYHVETAGVLWNGKRVFITFKLQEQVKVGNTDVIDNYVVFSDSRDGLAPKLYLTPVRVVCANTLGLSLKQIKAQSAPLRHTNNIHSRVNDAIIQMNLLRETTEKTQVVYQNMAATGVNFAQFLADSFLEKKAKDELLLTGNIATKTKNIISELLNIYSTGTGQSMAADGSGWKAYNAVTYYMSHGKGYKSPEVRMNNLLFGAEQTAMADAMEYCLIGNELQDTGKRLLEAVFN